MIFLLAAQGCTHTALRRTGVRAGRIQLADDSRVGSFGGIQRRHQACAAGPDDYYIKLVMITHILPPAAIMPT
jgi:hypothetical protein